MFIHKSIVMSESDDHQLNPASHAHTVPTTKPAITNSKPVVIHY